LCGGEWPLETIILETTTQNITVLGKLRTVHCNRRVHRGAQTAYHNDNAVSKGAMVSGGALQADKASKTLQDRTGITRAGG